MVKSSLSLARTTFSKYELLALAATLNWPLRKCTWVRRGPAVDGIVLRSAGLVDLLARSRTITTTMTISGIPVKEIVGVDSEGKIPLIRTSRVAYAIADQKSSLTVFNSQFEVESWSSSATDSRYSRALSASSSLIS